MFMSQWEETQDNLQLSLARNVFGMHAPIRIMMERKIVSTVCTYSDEATYRLQMKLMISKNMHMPALPRSNIHLDILMGRDERIDLVDVFEGWLNSLLQLPFLTPSL